MGNKRLYRKLLLDFSTKYTETAGDIRQALDAKDYEQAHSLVHNIKGLAGNLEATDLQTAAVNLEKLVKGVQEIPPSKEELNLKFTELENALTHALESTQSLSVSAEEGVGELPNDEIFDIPAEFAQDISKRIRDAAEMGDVTTLNDIAEEINARSASSAPLGKRIMQLVDDFDLDRIQKLADELDAFLKQLLS
jgi:HPt (histidine-containing phosphotransfer) domain-containing protein